MEEENAGRMDSILKVDANALLKIIRDLEHKLTEHQRQDKHPAWAQALESRLEQLEKEKSLYQDNKKHEDSKEVAGDGASSTAGMNLNTLTMEDRILSRMRKEFEGKLGNTHLHFESMMSSYGLEMERMHKLLQIRPTTSELQQVMVVINQVEQRSLAQMNDLQSFLQSNLRDRISEEMITVLDELKSNRSHNEEGYKLVNRQVQDYAQEISEIRQGAKNSSDALESTVTQLRADLKATNDNMFAMKANMDEELERTRRQVLDVHQELRNTIDVLHEHKRALDETIKKLEETNKQEIKRIDQHLGGVDEKLYMHQANLRELEQELAQLKQAYHTDIRDIKENQARTFKELSAQQTQMDSVTRLVEEFNAMDFPSKLAKHDDQMNKLTFDLADLGNSLNNVVTQDIKGINVKISVLQEQCNIRIPGMFTEHSAKIDKLADSLKLQQEMIDAIKLKDHAQDELIDSLLPLQDKVVVLFETKEKHEEDLTELKLGLTSAMDASSELARRIEELEETIDSLDETITNRMNRIRDTLMETLLEKQTETNHAVRHVRENLEVMSYHSGETGSVAQSVGVAAAQVAKAHNRKGSSMMKGGGSFADSGDNGAVAMRSGSVSMGADPTRRNTNYKVANINGAVVQGSHLESQSASTTSPTAAQPQHRPTHIASVSVATKKGGMSRSQSVAVMQGAVAPNMHTVTEEHHFQRQAQLPVAASNTGLPTPSSLQIPQPSDSSQYDPERSINLEEGFGEQSPEVQIPQAIANAVAVVSASLQNSAAHATAPQFQNQIDTNEHYAYPQSSSPPSPTMGNASYPETTSSTQQGSVAYRPNNVAQKTASAPVPNNITPARSEMLSTEYSHLLGNQVNVYANNVNPNYMYVNEAQFIADLCCNYEDISVKKKRVTNIPPVLCHNIAEVAYTIAEGVANTADFEMVELAMANVAGTTGVNELKYDENFVVTRRQQKIEEFLEIVTSMVAGTTPEVGMVRLDARTLFFSLVKKGLDLFLTKHNQVLVTGNSRLGRIKIPTCMACDRPLMERARLESVVSSNGSPAGKRGGFLESSNYEEDPASQTFQSGIHTEGSHSLPAIDRSFGGIEGMRPKTSQKGQIVDGNKKLAKVPRPTSQESIRNFPNMF